MSGRFQQHLLRSTTLASGHTPHAAFKIDIDQGLTKTYNASKDPSVTALRAW